ncbi:MAG: DNA double-strand break repair nuclease NurA [Armatimonadota bacterium]
MLELAKILRDIDALGRAHAEALSGRAGEFAAAERAMGEICADLDGARAKLAAAKTSWLTASFAESPDGATDLPGLPSRYAVLAVDGSQIAPDKNEATLCYLINSASIILYYGNGERPSATVTPSLCYKEEDLFEEYGGRRVPVSEKLLGMRRTLAESAEMEAAIARLSDVPAVALWDGSLIRWSLQNEPPDYKKRVLAEYLRAFETARERGVPVAGYISDPGSRDCVNTLRVALCDRSPIDCDRCEGEKPCDAIGSLTDSGVYRRRLADGQRSALFISSSKILEEYGEHAVWAYYLNVGKEVVRVEIPEWVARDARLVDLTHAVACDQAAKGRGYPVALSEAHEHAVVRGADRAAFYSAVERSLVKHGARVTRSLKRISKNY